MAQKIPYPGYDGKVVATPLGNERHRDPQGLEVGGQLPPGLDHQDRGPDLPWIEVPAELQEMVLRSVEWEGGKDVTNVDWALVERADEPIDSNVCVMAGGRSSGPE